MMEPSLTKRKSRFFISGTDTGVGKTTITCGLAAGFRARGLRVGVMKPVETGCDLHEDQLVPLDAIALREAAASSAPLAVICPYRYAAPLAPAAAADHEGCPAPDLHHIERAFERLAADVDVMLVEGAGGIAVPISWRENYVDLALALDLELILVVANRLGCINSAVLALDYAARRGVSVRGYILNDTDAKKSVAALTNVRSLERLTSVQRLGQVDYHGSVSADLCRRVL
jgi:dethiobiotin synthetase